MCDTLLALGTATADGSVLFGKNSDREPDEVQNLEVYPAAGHPEGASVKCTYLDIPQARRTRRVLLCRPYWMFGAEMGANDAGVVIGNEAVFTREKPEKTGLLGMDMLRLALERAASAAEARDRIISLLEKHGQGGKAGHTQNLSYMNGFLIADREEGFVLETVRRWWAWKKVRDFWSISNVISLTDDFDECSPGLIQNAVKKGYCRGESDFDFRRCYSDRVFTWGAQGKPRECRSRDFLAARKGRLKLADFMEALRDHGPDLKWRPWRQKGGTLCMHAANKLTRPTQSTCSLVARLDKTGAQYFTTAASNPCVSPFFPVFGKNADLPSAYKPGAAGFDERSYWWMSERLHRRAVFSFEEATRLARDIFLPLEKEFIERLGKNADGPGQGEMDECFEKARRATTDWGRAIAAMKTERTGPLFRRYWQRYNERDRVK